MVLSSTIWISLPTDAPCTVELDPENAAHLERLSAQLAHQAHEWSQLVLDGGRYIRGQLLAIDDTFAEFHWWNLSLLCGCNDALHRLAN